MHWFFVAATWLDILAISVTIGTLTCQAWVVPNNGGESTSRYLWRGLALALIVLTLTTGLILISRTLELDGASFSQLREAVPLVISHTQFGVIWRWRAGATMVLWAAWFVGRHRRWRGMAQCLLCLSLLVVVFSRSATGHAGDHGAFAVAVWVDSLHVIGGALWVGSLFAMSLMVFPSLHSQGEVNKALAADVFGRLSRIMAAALAIIISTGIYNSWQGLGNITALWESTYGQILITKLVLVAAMLTIGAHNRYRKLPRLERWAAGRDATVAPFVHSWRAVNIESLLGVLVIFAAAALHHGMPPADGHHRVDGSRQEPVSTTPPQVR